MCGKDSNMSKTEVDTLGETLPRVWERLKKSLIITQSPFRDTPTCVGKTWLEYVFMLQFVETLPRVWERPAISKEAPMARYQRHSHVCGKDYHFAVAKQNRFYETLPRVWERRIHMVPCLASC